MKKWLLFVSVAFAIYACTHEQVVNPLDLQLEKALVRLSPNQDISYFRLPESDDYASLPNQDPKNPVTATKVELGKMLFFETGLGLENKHVSSKQTFSCASCHIPEKAFTAGRFQGIADGAIGFGVSGEGRIKSSWFAGDEVDAQGARPLPVINTTFVTNALWTGTFGSFGVNEGTESVWHQDSLVEINFKGLQGLEANNERALIVHRLVVNKAVTDSLGYTKMFDEAFPDIPISERYTRQTAAYAIAAYFRTILTNRAPFQRWLKGETEAMTPQQKEGALVFFGKAG